MWEENTMSWIGRCSSTTVASGTTTVSSAATAATAANWFTAQNSNPADSNDSVKNINTLNTTSGNPYEFSKYVIKRTVYLTLAVGSDTAHNLTVTPTIEIKDGETGADITAVKVLVVTGDNCVILDKDSGETSLHTTDFDITADSVIAVDIYIYYDGEEASVYTNNVADLAAAEISLEFDVEVGSAS